MLLQRDPRTFARDETFVFDVANITLRHSWHLHARLTVHADTGRAAALADVSVETAQHAFAAACGVLTVAELSPQARQVLAAMRGMSRRIPGMPGSKARLRPRVLAALHLYGVPTVMLNLNPADLHCPLAFRLAALPVRMVGDDGIAQGLPDNLGERYALIARNPVAAVKFFTIFVDAFAFAFLNWDAKTRSFRGRSAFGDIR